MNFSQMNKRCPGNGFISKATLFGFKFVYDGISRNGGSVANIVEDGNGRVLGGLFEISNDHLISLDKYEGYPTSYSRAQFSVQDEHGNLFSAITYFRTGKQTGEPHPKYRRIVIQGARDCKLPEDYIKEHL